MKRLNLAKTLALTLIFSIIFMSCENDDNNTSNETMTSTYLYTSNNANGNITYYNVGDMSNVMMTTLVTSSTAADGVFYDADDDMLVQASRSNMMLEGFMDTSMSSTGASISIGISGSSDMMSPRELAVNGDYYVVADNADVDGDPDTPDGKLYVYMKDGNDFTLRNVITTDIKLWGITFDGESLYAIVDTTNELAVYSNFLANTGDMMLSATKTIAVEGIVRTHGLTYDAMSDTMVLTDIAAAANGQDDGGFHIITDFMSKFNNTADGGTLAMSDQIRVAGSSTMLGNPVDVAFDSETETVYIAEAGNNGGRILAFNNIGSGGNIAPVLNYDLASASSVYLVKY
ncbi:hypothetical protein PK35_07590 [Tamlana nanhaiensis]|uniref:NHL repeat containing protein n=1 Tax=Neotamlana nanhaiensis TaxID=1382798 RepID=A0A0D7W133_9FLAO|nr:hypothetical protein [Tamlana nanhaiensis]KJD32835.1 hypothetical protein PK35_07590 [Tamlana nanhaiensis]